MLHLDITVSCCVQHHLLLVAYHEACHCHGQSASSHCSCAPRFWLGVDYFDAGDFEVESAHVALAPAGSRVIVWPPVAASS